MMQLYKLAKGKR